jgi:integrase
MAATHCGQPLTVERLAALYIAHAQEYYRRRDGRPTREHLNIRANVASFVRTLPANLPAHAVSDAHVKDWLAAMAKAGRCRTYINSSLGRVKRMYVWAKDSGLLSAREIFEVCSVKPLKRFRCAAIEPEPTTPADLDALSRVMRDVPAAARDVLTVLALTGARCGEVAEARVRDVAVNGLAATLSPLQHKTAHHGQARAIPLFGRALDIIRTRATRARKPDAPLFPSPRQPGRSIDTQYVRANLRRACRRLGIDVITPHQIRHAVARATRASLGRDAAQALLGHTSPEMTEIYAPAPPEQALAAARHMARKGRRFA